MVLLSNLANALLREYDVSGSRVVLAESIGLHRESVAGTPEGHAEWAPRMANLANALMAEYERTSEPAVLEETIRDYQLAADSTAGQPARHARFQYGLAAALFRQAQATGALDTFDEVIDLLKEVVQATPDRHPNRPNRLAALGSVTFARFSEYPADMTQLDDGIAELREGLRLVPAGSVERGRILSNLGGLLDSKFEQQNDVEALREAAGIHRQAVAVTPAAHSERANRLCNLAISLIHQAGATGDDSLLNEAIDSCREALGSTSPGSSGRGQTLLALGTAYKRRYELTGVPEAVDAGIMAYREAAEDATAPARTRILAARDGGQLAASGGQTGHALSAFSSAVRLLDETAWIGLGRADQERLLGRLTGLPTDAAAMAITESRLELAVELLERGSGVLLVRQLEASAQLAVLRERAPDLAGQSAWINQALNPPAAIRVSDDELPGQPSQPGTTQRRVELARRRDSIIQQIRDRADLQDLVAPPPFSRLAEAAAHGPVIIINISSYRCDALIITSGTVLLVPLPEVTASAVTEQTEKLVDAADDKRTGRDPGTGMAMGPDRLPSIFPAPPDQPSSS
jgi:tetratricopeptide (TPR) repeat protein